MKMMPSELESRLLAALAGKKYGLLRDELVRALEADGVGTYTDAESVMYACRKLLSYGNVRREVERERLGSRERIRWYITDAGWEDLRRKMRHYHNLSLATARGLLGPKEDR